MTPVPRATSLLLKLLLILIAGFCSFTGIGQTPTFQDCLGAIPVCEDTITINYSHNGMGNYSNEIANVSSCYAPEQRSIWFTWTVQQSGLLRFVITPIASNQDHDWTLFNMTNATCSQLASSTGASAAMSRSNTWGVFGVNGPTGVSTPLGGSGTCNGPGATNGPKFCADISATVGQTYVLHITNWTGTSYGFTIDFSSSTAVIFDNVDPYMDSFLSATTCDPFDSLVVKFSENIICDNTSAADFTLVGPNGTHTITGVSSAACANNADYDDTYTIYFSPAVTTIGNYKLKIQGGAGYVEDLCGNLDVSDSLEFFYPGPTEFVYAQTNPLCYGQCTGTLNVIPTAGTAPFTYSWSGSLTGTTQQSNLCAGTYYLTLEDDYGCQMIDTMIITEPALLQVTVDTTYTVQCPNSSNCDGGAVVHGTGGVPPYNYLWSNGATWSIPSNLCSGINTVTVSDANGCMATNQAVVAIPDPIITTGFGDTLICITNNAALAVHTTGGNGPYSYVWTEGSLNGPVKSVYATTTVSPSLTTSYYVSSTDANGCAGDTGHVLVKVRPQLGAVIPVPDTICPYETATLQVNGTGGDSLYTYTWSAGGMGPTITVGPDESKWYYVTVSDYCGTPNHKDSVHVQVGGYPPIKASIQAEDDSLCRGENIFLIGNAYGGHNGPDEFHYKWSHTPDTNKVQFVSPQQTSVYAITIQDECLSPVGVDSFWVYVGETEVPEVSFSPNQPCGPATVQVLVDRPLNGYRYEWHFGDGKGLETTEEAELWHKYGDPGCYDVHLDLWSDFDCPASLDFPCAVKVLKVPMASFVHEPDAPTSLKPYVRFTNTSANEVHWDWTIGGSEAGSDSSVLHYFPDMEWPYEVRLIAESADGCTDTAITVIEYIRETTLYYPRSFTPNGDGRNDVFIIEGEAIDFNDFDLEIFDRWGEQVFRSTNPHRGWDGRSTAGQYVPIGVYGFVLHYRDRTGLMHVIQDQVVISKSGDDAGF